MYRIGIVGASSLVAKELSDELSSSALAASDIILLDDEKLTGQMTAAGDEVSFIQRLDEDSFRRMDFAFFAGESEVAATQWDDARKAGATIIDLTYSLEQKPGVLIQGPWIEEILGEPHSKVAELGTPAVVAAHPAALMLALVAARLKVALPVVSLAATVMEPASEHGRLAMDELHQQTVKLLSFQTLPKEQYDAQVAFNLLPTLGENAKIVLAGTESRIAKHYEALSAGRLPELTVQLIHTPVFHGYTASVLIELEKPATILEVEAALEGLHIDLVRETSDPPSNLSAAGQENILVRVTETGAAKDGTVRRFWLWLAADNLKLTALNGIACALELRSLRPQGTIQ